MAVKKRIDYLEKVDKRRKDGRIGYQQSCSPCDSLKARQDNSRLDFWQTDIKKGWHQVGIVKLFHRDPLRLHVRDPQRKQYTFRYVWFNEDFIYFLIWFKTLNSRYYYYVTNCGNKVIKLIYIDEVRSLFKCMK